MDTIGVDQLLEAMVFGRRVVVVRPSMTLARESLAEVMEMAEVRGLTFSATAANRNARVEQPPPINGSIRFMHPGGCRGYEFDTLAVDEQLASDDDVMAELLPLIAASSEPKLVRLLTE